MRLELSGIAQQSGGFWRVPGDSFLPKTVRGYGVGFIVFGAISLVLSIYSLLIPFLPDIALRTPPSALVTGVIGMALAVAELVVGRGLIEGRRVAVYGAIVVCAIVVPAVDGWGMVLALIAILPLFASAGRRWKRFR